MKNLIALVLVIGALIVSWLLPGALFSGDYEVSALIAVVSLLLIFGILILRRWQTGIYLFLVWITFEDLVRKFTGNNLLIFFTKDVLILITYLSFIYRQRFSRSENRFKNPIRAPLLLWMGLAFVQSFNPELVHPLVSIIGWRMMFFYVPLLYLGYEFVDSEVTLRKVMTVVVVLASLTAVIGLIQAVAGVEFLNPPGVLADTAGAMSLVYQKYAGGIRIYKPNSVFIDSGRFERFLWVSLLLTAGFICYLTGLDRKMTSARLVWGVLSLLSVSLIINGSRSHIVILIITAPVLLLIQQKVPSAGRWQQISRATRPLLRLLPLLVVAMWVFTGFYPEVIGPVLGFYQKTLLPSSEEFGLGYTFSSLMRNISLAIKESGLLGHGTGSASQGLQYLSNILYGNPYQLGATEGGYSAVIWEYGVLGPLVWLWWTVSLVLQEYRVVKRLRDSQFYGLALCVLLWTFVFLLPMFFKSVQMFQDYINNAYLWFWAGVLFKLPQLARRGDRLRIPAEDN